MMDDFQTLRSYWEQVQLIKFEFEILINVLYLCYVIVNRDRWLGNSARVFVLSFCLPICRLLHGRGH